MHLILATTLGTTTLHKWVNQDREMKKLAWAYMQGRAMFQLWAQTTVPYQYFTRQMGQ